MSDALTPSNGSDPQSPRKGPLNCLNGALNSGVLAWLALGLSRRVLAH